MSAIMKHSKHGIASCLIAIGIWFSLALIFGLIIAQISVSKLVGNVFHEFLNIEIGLVIGGHILGIIFGIVGSCAKNKKRVFAVIGLILNILPFVIIPLLFVFG